ncbi:MAG: efflux RND transporter periplasmic adaptor subunit [Campylobacteraceae bacterium]
MNKGWAFLVLITLVLFAGCNRTNNQQTVKNEVEVGYITLKPQEVALEEELSGRIKPILVSEVRPEVTGIIKEQNFKEGSFVNAGEVLYKIDDSIYQATYVQLEAALKNAEATLISTKSKSERYDELLKFDAISKQDVDDAKALYLQAESLVAEKNASLQSAKINLEKTKIKAPISGFIGISTVTKGALVTTSQTNPLVIIRYTKSIYIDLSQSNTALFELKKKLSNEHIKKGNLSVSLKLVDDSLYEYKGKLQLQEAVVDENTGSVTLRAEFPNPDGKLLSGMFVRAIIETAIDSNAFLVPQQAVQRDAKANPVITIIQDNNTTKQQIIKTNRALGSMWVVTEGVSSNDKIIIEGLNKISEKSIVKPVDITNKYINATKGL